MIIMHIDANSAYLSWTAAKLLEDGYKEDIRDIPSVIAGNPKKRHGIILAKSMAAKKYNIQTGESLFEAKKKCPNLEVFAPDYDLYMKCSDSMYELLREYSPKIERYSVDECFLDYTYSEKCFGDPVKIAYEIKERIKTELGFTVNVGVSVNKLLAKMAGELKKPDMVHTLFPEEIPSKLWPLSVDELFMVGRATNKRLRELNINTIGDLAKSDPYHIKSLLKSHGQLVWNYANGIDNSEVTLNDSLVQKSVGNSMTTPYDVKSLEDANKFLLSICERVGMRLRNINRKASLISMHYKTSEFKTCRKQVQLQSTFNNTDKIYKEACKLFLQCWNGEPLRQIGVSVSNLTKDDAQQLSIFDSKNLQKEDELNKVIDDIRKNFGKEAIIRGTFVNTKIRPISGGVNNGEYLMMGGQRNEDLSDPD